MKSCLVLIPLLAFASFACNSGPPPQIGTLPSFLATYSFSYGKRSTFEDEQWHSWYANSPLPYEAVASKFQAALTAEGFAVKSSEWAVGGTKIDPTDRSKWTRISLRRGPTQLKSLSGVIVLRTDRSNNSAHSVVVERFGENR